VQVVSTSQNSHEDQWKKRIDYERCNT
jgi:hypothetical protein